MRNSQENGQAHSASARSTLASTTLPCASILTQTAQCKSISSREGTVYNPLSCMRGMLFLLICSAVATTHPEVVLENLRSRNVLAGRWMVGVGEKNFPMDVDIQAGGEAFNSQVCPPCPTMN